MKKIILEGDVLKEVKTQADEINSYKTTIRSLSVSATTMERRLWEYLRKEFPGLSDNCYTETKDDNITLIDRMGDD